MRRITPTDVMTERTEKLASDPKHLKRLMAFWPESNIVHQLAKRLLLVPVQEPEYEIADEPEPAPVKKCVGNFSLNLAVRKVARRQGIDLAEIARRRGVRVRAVHGALRNDNPNMSTVQGFAEALGLSLAELIQEGYIR